MLDLHELLENIVLALGAAGRGESFWRALAIYSGISIAFALVCFAIWKAWP
jgi:hypothetical protein